MVGSGIGQSAASSEVAPSFDCGGAASPELRAQPRRTRFRGHFAFLVAFVTVFALGTAAPALAAYESANGYQTGGQAHYSKQRYHAKSQVLKYNLITATGKCGGGSFSLRPIRTSGSWMTKSVYWNIFASSYATKTWASANTTTSGYFKLVGNLVGNCGGGLPLSITFKGTIYF